MLLPQYPEPPLINRIRHVEGLHFSGAAGNPKEKDAGCLGGGIGALNSLERNQILFEADFVSIFL